MLFVMSNVYKKFTKKKDGEMDFSFNGGIVH